MRAEQFWENALEKAAAAAAVAVKVKFSDKKNVGSVSHLWTMYILLFIYNFTVIWSQTFEPISN